MASSTDRCPHCGQEQGPGPHHTFKRVVRPRMRFGAFKSGDLVEICERDIERRSTILGTMSVEDWEALLKQRAQPREPAGEGTSSVDLSSSFFDRLKDEAQATKAERAAEKGQPARKKV